jgi:hypothetical protein
MLGLEAISAHNGWAMAVTGAIIVMSGLAVLAFIISQLHKIIVLFEKRQEAPPPFVQPAAGINILNELDAAARMYKPLTAQLGESFHLTELYRVFEEEKLPHPHLTIRALRTAEYLVPLGEGIFRWKDNEQ